MSFSVFKTDQWQKLTFNKKKEALQELENEMAEKQGRTARNIETARLPMDGYYDGIRASGSLFINENYLKVDCKNYEAMEIIIHEGRHAYQDDAIVAYIADSIETCGLNNKPDILVIASWMRNLLVYNQPHGGLVSKIRYRFQPRERDAFDYAYDEMQSFVALFSGDTFFRGYIDDKTLIREDWKSKEEVFLSSVNSSSSCEDYCSKDTFDMYNIFVKKYCKILFTSYGESHHIFL